MDHFPIVYLCRILPFSQIPIQPPINAYKTHVLNVHVKAMKRQLGWLLTSRRRSRKGIVSNYYFRIFSVQLLFIYFGPFLILRSCSCKIDALKFNCARSEVSKEQTRSNRSGRGRYSIRDAASRSQAGLHSNPL